MEEPFGVTMDGSVARVTFDRPPHNYVNAEILARLADVLERLDRDPTCRAVLLQARGKTFCAGADVKAAASTPGAATVKDGNPLYREAARLNGSEKPIIVAVQGAAIGAGIGLALIGDFRIAGPHARFAASFVRLGFHPGFGLTATLPELIGHQAAKLMLLTGRSIDAAAALKMGLVDEVVPDGNPHDVALALAKEIAEAAPLAVQATLATLRRDRAQVVQRQTDHEDRVQRRHFATDDFREGVRALSERRTPMFSGR